MFLAWTFARLIANHIKLCLNDFSLSFVVHANFPASSNSSQIIDRISVHVKFFTISFNGTYALVNLEDEICSFKANVELGRLTREKNSELRSLLQWRKIQALNNFI